MEKELEGERVECGGKWEGRYEEKGGEGEQVGEASGS